MVGLMDGFAELFPVLLRVWIVFFAISYVRQSEARRCDLDVPSLSI